MPQKPNCYRLFFVFNILQLLSSKCICKKKCELKIVCCLLNFYQPAFSTGYFGLLLLLANRRNFPCGKRPMTGMGKDLVSFPMWCLFEVIFVGWNHSLLNGNIAIASCRVIKKTYTKNRIITTTINFKHIQIYNICMHKKINNAPFIHVHQVCILMVYVCIFMFLAWNIFSYFQTNVYIFI